MVEGIGLEIRQVAQAARGFESLLLRFFSFRNGCTIKYFYFNFGEVPKLAEGTPLERVQVVNSGARVQIPPSPLTKARGIVHGFYF